MHSGPDKGSPQLGGDLCFATRTGTRLGIEAHLFRAESCKDLSLWTRHIVTGCHAAAEMIKEVTTSEYGFYFLLISQVLWSVHTNTQNKGSKRGFHIDPIEQGYPDLFLEGHCPVELQD